MSRLVWVKAIIYTLRGLCSWCPLQSLPMKLLAQRNDDDGNSNFEFSALQTVYFYVLTCNINVLKNTYVALRIND